MRNAVNNIKQCSKCKEFKPCTIEFFAPCKTRKADFNSWCRMCYREQSRAWRLNNKERHRYSVKVWQKKHVENRKKIAKTYYTKHKEKILAYFRKRYKTDSEKVKAINKSWKERNPKAVVAIGENYRARKHKAEGKYTATDIQQQGDKQNWKCYWKFDGCLVDCSVKYHVDHVIPLSRGGSNWPSNIVISCPCCNSSKGNKLPSEFLTEVQSVYNK